MRPAESCTPRDVIPACEVSEPLILTAIRMAGTTFMAK